MRRGGFLSENRIGQCTRPATRSSSDEQECQNIDYGSLDTGSDTELSSWDELVLKPRQNPSLCLLLLGFLDCGDGAGCHVSFEHPSRLSYSGPRCIEVHSFKTCCCPRALHLDYLEGVRNFAGSIHVRFETSWGEQYGDWLCRLCCLVVMVQGCDFEG